jgi:hypothetical protein
MSFGFSLLFRHRRFHRGYRRFPGRQYQYQADPCGNQLTGWNQGW